MKYFVIAALLSQASAADGCKGLKGESWEKPGCEGDSKTKFKFVEGMDNKGKTIHGTGKCVPHNPSADAIATKDTTLAAKKETAEKADAAKTSRDALTSLYVCSEMKKDGKFCNPEDKSPVKDFFATHYP